MPDAIYATYILYLYTHRKKMPRFKPSWTKRKKGGHRSAAKVQNVRTGAAVSTEVAEDLVCQSTAEDLVCQSTAEEDDPVAPSIVSERVTVQTFLQGSQNVHKSSAIVVALCRHLVQKSLLRRHVTCTTLVQLPARVASPVPSCVYAITDRNCGLAKTGKGKTCSTCPAYDVQRSLGRMCGPTYVVYYTYVSGDAKSLVIQ